LQDSWAGSASDDNPESLAVQYAAAERLGVSSAALDNIPTEGMWSGTMADAQREKFGLEETSVVGTSKDLAHELADSPAVKAYIDTVYAHTQEYLASRGITEVNLYRGMTFSAPGWGISRPALPPEFDKTNMVADFGVAPGSDVGVAERDFALNPLASFSLQYGTAEAQFAQASNRAVGVVIQASVPAERIFSWPGTGAGCQREAEVIVVGGDSKVGVVMGAGTWSPEYSLPTYPGSGLTMTYADADAARAAQTKSFGDPGNTQERAEGGRFGAAQSDAEPEKPAREQLAPSVTSVEDQKLLTYIQEKSAALDARVVEYAEAAWGYKPGSEESQWAVDKGDFRDMLAKNDNVRELGDRVIAMANLNPELNAWLGDPENQPFGHVSGEGVTADDLHEWELTVNGDMANNDMSRVGYGIKMPGGDNPAPADLAAATAYFAVAEAQFAWADSAVEGASSALQESAKDAFGIPEGMVGGGEFEGEPANALSDALVQATYDRTQDELRSAGISEVTLFRGMAWGQEWNTAEAPDWYQSTIETGEITPGGEATAAVDVTLNPLSSWSASEEVADHFASKAGEASSAKLEATVPASRVFSTPFTGPGCLSEMEYIVLGSGTVQVTAR
jgi:hypothetical protein